VTELFTQSNESSERSGRIGQVIVSLVTLVVGFIGSYSGLFGRGLHSGVGLGFLAVATVIGVLGLIGLALRTKPSSSVVGSTISSAAICLLLGAWMAVALLVVRFL
jgi:hypothetical protein